MGLQIENETNVSFDFDIEEIAKQAIGITIELENCPYEVAAGLLLTHDESVQELNSQYRGKDKTTDVLSFPMNDRARLKKLFTWQDTSEDSEDENDSEHEEAIGHSEDAEELDLPEDCHLFDSSFDPESGELILGDIVISVDTLINQAREYGHSIKREYAFLIVHSVLHLLGYDHLEEDERLLMEEKQDKILNTMGIIRNDNQSS